MPRMPVFALRKNVVEWMMDSVQPHTWHHRSDCKSYNSNIEATIANGKGSGTRSVHLTNLAGKPIRIIWLRHSPSSTDKCCRLEYMVWRGMSVKIQYICMSRESKVIVSDNKVDKAYMKTFRWTCAQRRVHRVRQ